MYIYTCIHATRDRDSQMNNNLQSTIINKQPLAACCIVHCAGSADFEPILHSYCICIAYCILLLHHDDLFFSVFIFILVLALADRLAVDLTAMFILN